MDKENLNIELKEIIRTVKKRLYIIVPLTILAFLFSLYYYNTNKPKPTYFVKTSIIIGNSMDSTGTKYQIDDVNQYKGLMSTYCSIAKTTIVSEKTLDKLKLNISPEILKNSLRAEGEQDTQFMDLSLVWGDSRQGVDILTTLTDVFIEEAKNIYPTCNVKVMEKVGKPQIILPSDKRIYLVLGPIGGIVISVLIIFALDFMDDTIKTEEEVEDYLKLPVIGSVPRIRKKAQIISLRTLGNLHSYYIEAYRTLRNNIYFSSIYKEVKSIVVTSSRPGEGKTTTAAMLAISLAQAGKKTILIDCDLRQSNVHRLFNISSRVGLTNVLLGEERFNRAVYKSDIENLFILSAGVKPPDPSEILSSNKMKDFIDMLRHDFEYIIIDTPPIGIIADAQVLSGLVDGYILIVSSGESIEKEVLKSKKLIEHMHCRILGVVLNKLKYPLNYRYYNYYYKDKDKSRKIGRRGRRIREEQVFAINNHLDINIEGRSGLIS